MLPWCASPEVSFPHSQLEGAVAFPCKGCGRVHALPPQDFNNQGCPVATMPRREGENRGCTKKQEIPIGSPLLKLFSKSFLVSTLPGFQSQVTPVLSAYFSGRLLGSLLFFCTKAAHPWNQTVLQVTSFVVIESISLSDPKTLPPG